VKITPVASIPAEVGIPLAGAAILRCDVGPVWLTAEMSEARALAALKPDMSALAEWAESLHATGANLFAPSGEKDCAFHVRSFAPGHGIPEDPVCGSGNISVAAYLRHLKKYNGSYVARQGMQMGRDGRVHMRVTADSIDLGGRAVTCVEGSLNA
jgi:PhzF family phenazine biosynthesis protein